MRQLGRRQRRHERGEGGEEQEGREVVRGIIGVLDMRYYLPHRHFPRCRQYPGRAAARPRISSAVPCRASAEAAAAYVAGAGVAGGGRCATFPGRRAP